MNDKYFNKIEMEKLTEEQRNILKDESGEDRLTDEQRRAVLEKGKILVSAAAGSGKTSTMIKRIVLMMAKGMPLRRMLILVYNEAAAEELKKKLHYKLFTEAARSGGALRDLFRRELDELSFAHISTIHSFCYSLIRENFDKLGLSPDFEVLDEQTHKAYMNSALDEVLNRYTEQGNDVFDDITEIFLRSRKEDNLKACILKLYDLMDIQPNRQVFLDLIQECYSKFKGSRFEKEIVRIFKTHFNAALESLVEVKPYIENTSLQSYINAVPIYIELSKRIIDQDSVEEMGELASSFLAPELERRGKKLTEYEKAISDDVKADFDYLKGEISSLSDLYHSLSRYEIYHAQNALYINKIIELTSEFAKELEKLKREHNAMSFEDLMHCTVRLLEEYPDIAASYDAVFVDEYQDINPTQEFIVSHLVKGECFMVGDVKQSIYGFRLADPTIFLSRQTRYLEGEGVAIDFNRNFRSKQRILSFVNGVFDAVMVKGLADVDYKNTASFVIDKEREKGESVDEVQLHIFASTGDKKRSVMGLYDITAPDDSAKLTAAQNEGMFIANEIRRMVGHAVVEGENGRTMRYDDIAILFRNRSKEAQQILQVLANEGIPLSTNTFRAEAGGVENELISMLQVIDNPRQDIPLAGYLLSFFGGYSEEELATIAARQGKDLYDKLLGARKDGVLADKIAATLSTLEKYRIKASFKSVSELINGIVSDHMYDAYLMRKSEANLYTLRNFAASTSAKDLSLGAFLEAYAEFSSDSSSASGGNRVQVSTFHGFKGLEIPVVFVSDLAHGFNNEGLRSDLLTESRGFVGMKFYDMDKKFRYTTLSHTALGMLIKEDRYKDEMRLLYVALTRAKQRMYITASVSANKLASFGTATDAFSATNDLAYIEKAIHIGDCVIDVVKHQDPLCREIVDKRIYQSASDLIDAVIKRRTFEYPYKRSTGLAMKFSVSQLDSVDEQTVRVYDESADAGTAYHKVMQNIDYSATTIEAVRGEIDRLVEEKRLTEEERALVDEENILRCMLSPVMQEARRATATGRCMREYPFMMYVPARRLSDSDEFNTDDRVLCQGVVDLFIDGEKKIVVDFKNSALRDENTLKKYKKQLDLYKIAIESAFSVKLDDVLLYSFKTGKAISVLD